MITIQNNQKPFKRIKRRVQSLTPKINIQILTFFTFVRGKQIFRYLKTMDMMKGFFSKCHLKMLLLKNLKFLFLLSCHILQFFIDLDTFAILLLLLFLLLLL